ncbi:MAG TPA: hypothetical protein VF596_04045 [Pyrinomonadaceae bacterium]
MRVTTIFVLFLLINTNISSFAFSSNRLAPPDKETGNKQIETRVYLRRQCILTESTANSTAKPEFFGAIAGIFVPLLIGKALSGVSSALKKAGSEEVLKDTGNYPTYLYQLSNIDQERKLALNPDFGCVIMARGVFNSPDPEGYMDQSKVEFPKDGLFLDKDQSSDRIVRLNKCNIPIKEIVALYEAEIKPSDDKTAFLYESRFLEVNSFQGSRSSDSRAIVISLAINGAGSKEGSSTLSLALLNLGELKKGAVLGPNELKKRRSSWLGGIGISDNVLKSIDKIKIPQGKNIGVMPVTLEGTFAETEKGSKALLFIAEVLNAAEKDLTKTISGEILKDRDAEDIKEADAIEKLRQEEESAYAAYLIAVAASKKPNLTSEEQKAKDFDVERTQRIWCLKLKTLKAIGIIPSGTRSSICT